MQNYLWLYICFYKQQYKILCYLVLSACISYYFDFYRLITSFLILSFISKCIDLKFGCHQNIIINIRLSIIKFVDLFKQSTVDDLNGIELATHIIHVSLLFLRNQPQIL